MVEKIWTNVAPVLSDFTGSFTIAWINIKFKMDEEKCTVKYVDCILSGFTSWFTGGIDAVCTKLEPVIKSCSGGECQRCLPVHVEIWETYGIHVGGLGSAGYKRKMSEKTFYGCTDCSKKCCEGAEKIYQDGEWPPHDTKWSNSSESKIERDLLIPKQSVYVPNPFMFMMNPMMKSMINPEEESKDKSRKGIL